MKHSAFEIELHSPLGPRPGKLALWERGNHVLGAMELLNRFHLVEGTVVEDHGYSLSTVFETVTESVPCLIHCSVEQGELSGTAETNRGNWELTGKLLKEESL